MVSVVKKAKKKIFKPAQEEVVKIGETAKEQITGKQEPGESVMVKVMTRSDGKTPDVSVEEEREMKQAAIRGLQRVREEAEKESQKAKEKEAKRLQKPQEVIQQPGEPIKKSLEGSLLPTSPQPRGAPPGAAGKAKKTEARPGKN